MAVNIPIFPGSASFFAGDTPFGFYDNDCDFQIDAERIAVWAARRLGYPIVAVELQDKNLFAAFEEAVTEYGHQVSTYSARDNFLALAGFPTGSANLSGKYIEPTLTGLFKLAKQYGSEVGAGGNLTWFTGSVAVTANKQVYDLISDAVVESGSLATDNFTVRKVFHETDPSIIKYFDPYLGTGVSSQQFLEQFGWGSMSPSINFLMLPMNHDVLRIQAVEFNDHIRRSGYSFQLTNNRLRIFPIPTSAFTLWFNYTLDKEAVAALDGGEGGKITDHSNIPYGRPIYEYINSIGRQWIRKYTLALAKEMLGYVRGKYQDIVIPGESTTLNSGDLIAAAEAEKNALIEDLREILDEFSRQSQLERKQAEAEILSDQLGRVPLKIYVG